MIDEPRESGPPAHRRLFFAFWPEDQTRDAFEAAITLSALGVDQQQVRGFAESALDQLAASGT